MMFHVLLDQLNSTERLLKNNYLAKILTSCSYLIFINYKLMSFSNKEKKMKNVYHFLKKLYNEKKISQKIAFFT